MMKKIDKKDNDYEENLFEFEDLEEKDEFIDEMMNNINEAKSLATAWRDEAYIEEQFYAGDQWDSNDIDVLRQESRPVITFNRMVKIINAVTGIEIQNRQEPIFEPTEENDNGLAEVITQAVRWTRKKCDAEDAESDAFEDVIKVGMGWIETRIDYEEDLDGKILIEQLDPFDMLWDAHAFKSNLSDAKWLARVKHMDKKSFKELWGDAEPEGGNFWDGEVGMDSDEARPAPERYQGNSNSNNMVAKNPICVIQYQYWERETVYRYVDLDEEIKIVTADSFKKIKPMLEEAGISYIKQHRKVYKQAFVNGRQILEMGRCPINGFTFQCITGLYDKPENRFFGLTRLLLDPQRWSNKWLSQLLHIINSNAKGGIIVEDGAFKYHEKAVREWAKPNSVTVVNTGKMGSIQQKQLPPYPQAIDQIFRFSLEAFQDVTGINAEILGIVDRTQAGVLETQRKEAVYGQLQKFFKSLRQYRKDNGRIVLEFIAKYIATEDGSRFIRIVGDEGEKFVPLLKDDMAIKYDITVNDMPTAPNQKERTASLIMTLIPTMMQAGLPMTPKVLDYLPLPQPLINSWKEAIMPNPEMEGMARQKEELELMLNQINLERQQMKNQDLGADITLKEAKAQKEMAMASDYVQKAENRDLEALEPVIKAYEAQEKQMRENLKLILQEKQDMINKTYGI